MPLECRVVTTFDELDGLAREWQRLFSQGERREVFDTIEWARAWWRVHGEGHRLLTPTVYDGQRLVAVWPLVVEQSTLRFLGHVGSDYKDILCEPGFEGDAAAAMLQALLARSEWSTAVLDNVPTRSRLRPALEVLPLGLREYVHVSHLTTCPTVRLDGADRERILHDILRKESLRRHEKKLARFGTVTFRHVEDRDEIVAHLPRFFEQHVQRRALTQAGSLFLGDEARASYRAMVDELDPRTTLRFGVIDLDGRAVAYHFGFELAGKFVWYKPTFDIDYWDCGPGEVLLASLFRYVRDAGLREFDFTIGDEAFKSRFATHQESNLQVRIYRPGVVGWVHRALQGAKDRVKREHPQGYETLRGLAERLGECRQQGSSWRAVGCVLDGLTKDTFESREVIAYEVERPFHTPSSGGPATALEIEPLTLASLVNLAAGDSELGRTLDIGRARAWLKAGDTMWWARSGPATVCIAWAARRSVVSASRTGGRAQLQLAEPCLVLDQLWAPSETNPAALASAIGSLVAALAQSGDTAAYVLCDSEARPMCRAVAGLGGRRVARFWYRRAWGDESESVDSVALPARPAQPTPTAT